MANIKSFPNNRDEFIGAEEVMRWHHGRTSGVFGADGNATVSPVLDTMAVTVSDGIGWLANDGGNGVVWWIDEEAKNGSQLRLNVDIADAVLPRIDRVVVSWQTSNYVALPEVVILKGTPASAPVAPALTNNSMMRQISLAAIRIPAGATKVDSSMITDERLDSSVCGIVTDSVGIDTSLMQAQFESFFRRSIEEQNEYLEQQKSAWDAYFEAVQNDTLVPVPTPEDAKKAMLVNEDGNGYSLEEIQTNIPVTSTPEEGVELWIDPTEDTIEGSHISNTNNPHKVTANQVGARPNTWTPTASEVGAVYSKLLWQNASPTSAFGGQTVTFTANTYTHFRIIFGGTGGAIQADVTFPVGAKAHVSVNSGEEGQNSGPGVFASRMATETTRNSITFGSAYYARVSSGSFSWSGHNGFLMPLYIYGVGGLN